MENWWAGSLWDPRSPESGDFFGTDFTCSSSMPDVLAALHSSDGYNERLAVAVTQDDLREMQRLLSSADVTPALHLALKMGASTETVDLLATCCDHLNVWLPEPVVVTWARASCLAALERSTKRRDDGANGAAGRLDALRWAGADVNAVGRGCETALHIVARMLQLLRQERGYGCAIRNEFQVARELRTIWHDLVARGADASVLDGEGFSAIERLSESECNELLASKRRSYGMKRYDRTRLRGEDPSDAWLWSPTRSYGSSARSL